MLKVAIGSMSDIVKIDVCNCYSTVQDNLFGLFQRINVKCIETDNDREYWLCTCCSAIIEEKNGWIDND